jgi:hypothetical protein
MLNKWCAVYRCTLQSLIFSLFFVISAQAQTDNLKLIPQPKYVEQHKGAFRLTATTRIVIAAAHASEDRFAAEVLAEEIHSATGRRIPIAASVTVAPPAAIYLSRLDARTRSTFKKLRLDPTDLDPEGYLIHADSRGILVAAATGQGLFYGVQTLRQLIREAPAERSSQPDHAGKRWVCPAVAIKDWPAMRWRGIHDDLSRGPVRTLDYMKRQVRTIAAYKLNLFALYIEHVFAYQSQAAAIPQEGALKPEEVRELVVYARKYYVTVLPEQQTFGHLHHLLKYEIYSDVAETPHGHVLTPVNPRSYELVRQMYSELVPLFPGPFVHIGGDETVELGEGQTRDLVQHQGVGPVYLEHLKRVSEILQPYRKKLLFWGDIAIHYPEMLNILPKEMIAVPWKYSAQPDYNDDIAPFRKAGFDVMVAPGANNWSRIVPDYATAFTNIRNFVRDGQKAGAFGMLNTVWNDDGEAPFALTWPAVIFGAACSWQAGESSVKDFENAYDWAFYRNAADTAFTDAIRSLDRAQSLLAKQGVQGAMDSAFWLDPFTEAGARYAAKVLPVVHELRLDAETAIGLLAQHRAQAGMNLETLDALRFAAMRLDALGMKVQYTAECSRFYQLAYESQNRGGAGRYISELSGFGGRLDDLRDSVTRLRAAYEKLWNDENRPYWIGNVLVRYDVSAARYQEKIEALRSVAANRRNGGALPPPESLGFYAPETAP